MAEDPSVGGADSRAGRTHITPQKSDSLWYKAKVIAPIAALLAVVVTATWFFTDYDKRITLLEVSNAEQDHQINRNSTNIAGIQQWVPTVDLKLALLLQHFGISIPKP